MGVSGMGTLWLGFLAVVLTSWISEAASVFQPISVSHRSAALELFTSVDGSYASLEETYEALRTFEVLKIEKSSGASLVACEAVSKTLGSSSSTLKDLYYALKVNGLASCKVNEAVYEGIVLRLHAAIKDANSLLDFYYSVGSLVLVKELTSNTDLHVDNAEGIFRSIKTLSQNDGRWRYSSSNPESTMLATGLAFETFAGVISLAPSEIDQTLIRTLKNDVQKLFDNIGKYDDESFFFGEKIISAHAIQGPLPDTASIVKGLSALAVAMPTSLNLPQDKVLGLAKFFLSIGIPGHHKDFFYQVDALACLEDDRFFIPLILSLPSTVISLTKKEPLKVRVSTVFGSSAPALTVKLVQAFSSGSKGSSLIESQDLKFNPENEVHFLDSFPRSLDVGKYTFVFEIVLHEPENGKAYTTRAQTKVPLFITGLINIDDAEIAILDSDRSTESKKKLDLAKEGLISLSANHLQKLRLSFKLTTPVERVFKPHQALLKLKHESGVDHIFLVKNSKKKFEIILDFLGLVEKFYYLSGRYELQLTLGDAAMENSLLRNIGHIELDLPERPEKAPSPPLQAVDPRTRYGPKTEITHIFRAPEKRPPTNLSFAFLGLSLLPLLPFLVGLLRLGVNLKNFPSSAVPATFALLFQCGIGAVLSLYALFWLKLDLFTTLKSLGFMGVFLVVVGHRILSYLSAASNKVKSV